ncbi:serine/threonine protein kinase [Bacillus cereus group sp. BceL062]|uniref:serine/threonine protein kinase n=1 Tax=Bacillus cereus group sp. BceL062 TaxID=3445166 RepID=UPI003F2778D5
MNIINNYKVIETLGSGAFGTTYLVEKDNNTYALKLIRENIMILDNNDVRRIEREIKILKTVPGNGTVKYIDDGLYEDGPDKYRYIVMEYVQGENLESFIKRSGSLAVHIASKIIFNVFTAINNIHLAGVLHRDLKPANIILTDEKEYNVTILDFGISKLIDASTLTTTGQGMGTYAYMPPEQLKSAADIDYRADYYSIGSIFYELLTNEKPLQMTNQLEAMYKIMTEQPTPVINKVQNIPIELSQLIETLLLKEPFQRKYNFDEIMIILESLIKRKKGKDFIYNHKPNSLEFLVLPQNNDAKTVIQLENLDGAVFNAPSLVHSDKNYLGLQKKDTSRLIIDPYVQTLGYSAFTTKETYKKLPYIISKLRKETPKDFILASDISQRAKQVMDFQLDYNSNILLSPVHLYNSVKDPWIKTDYNLYKASKSYLDSLNIRRPLYYGIYLNIEKFEDIGDIDQFVNYISAAQPDGYYLQIAGDFGTLNSNHYYAYAYLVKILSHSNKEIIISRINDFSLGLLAIGANTIAISLGQGDSFKEEFLNKQESGGAKRRYYIPELLGLYNENILADILSTKAGKKLICNCFYCESSTKIDKLTNFHNTIQHHYTVKKQQIDEYSILSNEERLRKFSTSVDFAQQYIKEILKEKKIKNLNYKHLGIWKEVITEVSKMDLAQPSGI